MIITIIHTYHFSHVYLHHSNRQSIITNSLIPLCWEGKKGHNQSARHSSKGRIPKFKLFLSILTNKRQTNSSRIVIKYQVNQSDKYFQDKNKINNERH